MKNKGLAILLMISIIILIIAIPKEVNASSDIIVAIDPGHGAEDSGTTYGNLKEKDINWQIAQRIKWRLDQTSGITGIIIRDYNENPSLEERANRAKDRNANLYVSVHINATGGSYSVRGSEVYVTAYNAEARYNNYCSQLAYSVLDNLRQVGVPSRDSNPIIKYSTNPSRIYPDGTRADWMGMIRNPVYNGIPAILIEHCYITNYEDRNSFLTSEEKRNTLGDADANAIIANKELFRKGIEYLGGAKDENALISYQAQLQNIGWTNWAKDGETLGTTGADTRLETLKISLNENLKEELQYRAHVESIGWMDWVSDSENAGTIGQAKRVEAVQIKLRNSENYNIYYRVHVQDIGWMPWVENGEVAGTTGQAKRIEAIEIRLEKIDNNKDTEEPENPSKPIEPEKPTDPKESENPSKPTEPEKPDEPEDSSDDKVNNKINVLYSSHVEDIGWMDFVQDGNTSGTTGKAKRLEAIKIKLKGIDESIEKPIEYKVHVQDIGWMPWVENGKLAGTTGQSKRIEAIQIKLNSKIAKTIKYRVHVEDIGWTSWVKNGEIAGTTGQAKRIEAIEISIE